MSDFPAFTDHSKEVICTLSNFGVGPESSTMGLQDSAAVWPSANLAIYVPVLIPYPITIVKMFWENGITVGTNSVDVGIYDSAGNRLVSSGSTLTSGASVIQSVDITDTALSPGLYYIAMAMGGTTDTIVRISATVPVPRAMGVLEQASAFALPATATFTGATTGLIPKLTMTAKTTI